MTTVAMTIAGSDPSGGAGAQADLRTFHQLGVYGTSVLTLLTVQNTRGVDAVDPLPGPFVAAQLEAVVGDIPPKAAKTGALGTAEIIELLADRAARFDFPLVVDPVMVSKHGHPLLEDDAVGIFIERLLPRAFLVTPNVFEARRLTGRSAEGLGRMEDAARAIADLGPRHVVVKGARHADRATDVLLSEGRIHHLPGRLIDTASTHGSGCVFSAAITARLALGDRVLEAVRLAKEFITRAIETAPGLGRGFGPVNMHAAAQAGGED